ncbi:MAG TPA: hypothetical protein VG714_10325 [Acidobacteriaceae bacterium]|nr:hypothetical protein [Acidobacteriaceae bacterium]
MRVKQFMGRAVIALLGALAVAYVGDWAIWRARVAAGGGMGSIEVGVLIETPLKGNKEEYDWAGRQTVDCSRSIFPQAGEGACWWLARKGTIEEK